MNQAYLDELDGKIDDDFWAECSAQWQVEKTRIEERLARHCQADSAYLELGVRLIDVASRARELYLNQGLVERRGFLGSILAGFPCARPDGGRNHPAAQRTGGREQEFKSAGMGWLAGFEPATPRSTIWCSNR